MNDVELEVHCRRLQRASTACEVAREARDLAILEAHEAGLSFSRIAREIGISKTRAFQIGTKKSGRALDSGTKSV